MLCSLMGPESRLLYPHRLFSQAAEHELSPVAHMTTVSCALTEILERDQLKKSFNILQKANTLPFIFIKTQQLVCSREARETDL